ncbi:MAG TPA: prepilin peptidase [Polyangiales bacterium]|nr:prepilin peptidase [Polyangiales bacterium]
MDLLVSELPAGFLLGMAFVFGAIWGSFFNVAIYRWPRDESVVRPASKCPGCGAPVAARYNLPIVGYLMLRGKTACCGTKLSPRYPMVEALSGVLCLAVVHRFMVEAPPETPFLHALLTAVCYFAFVGGLLIATFVDLEHMQIPDEVSLPGAALGLVSVMWRDPAHVADAAIGAGLGFLVVQVIFVWSYEHLTGRRGMGEGDSKLLMMIGAFLGYQGVAVSIFAGAAQGLLAFVVMRLFGKREPLPSLPPLAAGDRQADGSIAEDAEDDEDYEPEPQYWGHLKLPFGPFLALGALEFLFFGDVLIDVWFGIFS